MEIDTLPQTTLDKVAALQNDSRRRAVVDLLHSSGWKRITRFPRTERKRRTVGRWGNFGRTANLRTDSADLPTVTPESLTVAA